MKFKFKPKYIVIASVNAAAISAALILSAFGNSTAQKQTYNFASQRWKGESKDDFSQISCFFSDDSGFNAESVNSVRSQITNALKDAAFDTESGKKIFADSYSCCIGNQPIKCDVSGRAVSEVTAVSGDYFFFHNFKLINGSFFTDSDIMQDGAVIDHELAWLLYGSDDVTGMNIYINNVKCYIAGVIASPETKAEKRCIGENSKVYISYELATSISNTANSSSSLTSDATNEIKIFNSVQNYECILPEPVENFGINSFKKIVGDIYKENVSVINNSERFSPQKRVKAMKNISDSVIRNDGIKLPYWENASRITEFKLSYIYTVRKYLLFIPLITLLWLIVTGYKCYNRNKKNMKRKTVEFFSRIFKRKK